MFSKLKEQNISKKITATATSIALICSLVIGIVSAICLAVVMVRGRQMYTDNLTPLKPIYQAQADFQTIRSDLKSMALEGMTGKVTGLYTPSVIQKLENDIDSQLNTYSKYISSDADRKNFDTIQTDIKKYKKIINSLEGNIKGNEILQFMSTLNNSSDLSDEIKSGISNAFTIKNDQAAQENTTSMVIFIAAIILILLLTGAFIILFSKISKKIAEGISGPILKMVTAAESIADGSLDVDLKVDTMDETATLAGAFQKIVDALRLMKADVNMMIGEALEGQLETRADSSKQKGDYRAIIEGVNKMFDTIKQPLDVASDFINRLADGEQQENLENCYKGYYAVLIENLNKVQTSFTYLVKEADKLARAGLEGNLDVRGDEASLKGTYAKIIHGVNETFDAIKAPLDVASQFIGNLAVGDGQKDIENVYKGYYAKLIDNLNEVRRSLAFMLQQSSRLTEAGKNGDLNLRGDTGALKGGYFDVINGFNKTLDSIVTPLNEAKLVLSKMTVNDYTVSVTGNYNGMLADFANSVNEVMAAFKRVENIFILMSKGDFSLIDSYKKIGKRSDNDNMVPSAIAMMQALTDLIEQSGSLSEAALNGNLSVRGDEIKFEGGYRNIIEGMNGTMEAFAAPIEEASHVLRDFSQGDLTVSVNGEYKGAYDLIKRSLNSAIEAFNSLLSEISVSAGQVAAGSKQVSVGSQSLSQGAAEQASSVEELTSSVTEVAAQTRKNAQNASKANVLAADAQQDASLGNEKMGQMLDSIRSISESSSNISKIIKVIDDIAFQTNILALNAAVEAARAGQYGKGFAVVAEEVRNLAAKSADAAKETTALIEGSAGKVEAGTKIANETAEMLGKISGSVKEATDLVGSIAAASNEQATAIAQIDQGLSQVSTVVQTNSATAEESAASSEELSAQANMLTQMVGRFRLRADGTQKAPASSLEEPAELAAAQKQSGVAYGKY
jgi:Methyl-accepting chemotaxis protein